MANRVLWLVVLAAIQPACSDGRNVMNIEKVDEIPFPPEQVYAAWVSSDTVIPPATAMDVNPVEGGHYRLIMETPEFVGRNEGRFLAVDPGTHIRYTWEWNRDGEISEIDVRFSASAAGTRITLVHSGFRSQVSTEMHDSGWDSYVEGFTAFLQNP